MNYKDELRNQAAVKRLETKIVEIESKVVVEKITISCMGLILAGASAVMYLVMSMP